MHKFNGKEYPCCTSLTMGVIGGKWKTVILFYLIDGKLRYSELRKKMGTVTERTLSLQLQQLQDDGVIQREVFYTKPPLKVEYSLTEFGKSLIPLLQAIAQWGDYALENYSPKETVD
ncbi:MAG: winged helix-turn-helix transcriptional regulator [Tenacibaculum sp.]|nr:winged helix-turn-helix transcriptional regulator [Tenacibaculum sp.]